MANFNEELNLKNKEVEILMKRIKDLNVSYMATAGYTAEHLPSKALNIQKYNAN